MSLIAVIGDASTTTALALTAMWPAGGDVFLMEADTSGGDLAAWLDVPEQPGLASSVAAAPSGSWPVIASHLQQAASGVRVLVAPLRALEASVVVREAATRLVPTMSALDGAVVIADCGRQQANVLSPVVAQAGLALVTIRQAKPSARAAGARLDRVAELVDVLATRSIPTVGVLIGEEPYTAGEVAVFLGGAASPLPTLVVADDPFGAALLAGRPAGQRRALRSRLLRSAVSVAAELAVRIRSTRTLTATETSR